MNDDKSLANRAAAAYEQWISTQNASTRERKWLHPQTEGISQQVFRENMPRGDGYDGTGDKHALQIEELTEFARDELDAADALVYRRREIDPLLGHPKPSYEQLAAETGRPIHDLYKCMELCRRKLARRRFESPLPVERADPQQQSPASVIPPPAAKLMADPVGLIKNVKNDAACLAALDWVPFDSTGIENSAVQLADAHNAVAAWLGLDVRLHITRTSYVFTDSAGREPQPEEFLRASAVFARALKSNHQLIFVAAYIFVSHARLLTVPEVQMETFRALSKAKWQRELQHTPRGKLIKEMATQRDIEFSSYVRAERQRDKNGGPKDLRTNWSRHATAIGDRLQRTGQDGPKKAKSSKRK